MTEYDEEKTRLQRLEEEITSMQDIIKQQREKKTGFKLPWKTRALFKKAVKAKDHVLVLYLDKNYISRFLLVKVTSGDVVIIDNKVHIINPRYAFRFGKDVVYIIKEIDRRPVSNVDYNKIRKRKDDTDADVPLIKAVLGAYKRQQESTMKGKTIWIVLGIIALLALVGYALFGGGA